MFAQSVLDKVKASAMAYASVKSISHKESTSLSDQISRLLSCKYSDQELEKSDILGEITLAASKAIRCEQDKARENSSLYNSNRHIALHDLRIRLQKKREKLISAL